MGERLFTTMTLNDLECPIQLNVRVRMLWISELSNVHAWLKNMDLDCQRQNVVNELAAVSDHMICYANFRACLLQRGDEPEWSR